MRFTFLNPNTKAPSFKARYHSYVFVSLAIAQILSISFAILLLWGYLSVFDPSYVGMAAILFILLAFLLAYSSPQNSHIVSIVSLLGIQALVLTTLPKFFYMRFFDSGFVLGIDDLFMFMVLFDVFVVTLIFYFNTVFQPHEQG